MNNFGLDCSYFPLIEYGEIIISTMTVMLVLIHFCCMFCTESQTKSLLKQGEQYGFPFCSLKMPWLSCRRQKAHTKCSGWNLRSIAEMQRPTMGLPHAPHRVPCREWKCCEQSGRPSISMKQPSVKGFRQSWKEEQSKRGDGGGKMEERRDEERQKNG